MMDFFPTHGFFFTIFTDDIDDENFYMDFSV
jgi:hypothetical protein